MASRLMQVSVETLRRDLRVLENAGQIRRSHGVFVPTEIGRHENPMSVREVNDADQKQRIAQVAASLIGEATTLYLDEGVIPRFMVRHLPVDRVLTVVTASLPTAMALVEATAHDVVVVGGAVRRKTLATLGGIGTGPTAGLFVDLAIMGTNGVSVEHGLTTPDPEVARVKEAAMWASRRRILICEHLKFGVVSFARFAELADIGHIVTGAELPRSMARRFEAAGPTVLRV